MSLSCPTPREGWQPYYDNGQQVIYHGDCRASLRWESMASFVVSDPPYGIGYVRTEGGKHVTGRKGDAKRNSIPIVGDDQPFDPTRWGEFAHCILWGADHYCRRLPVVMGEHRLVWDKLDGIEAFDTFADVEFAWCNWPGKDEIIRLLWKGVLQGDKANNGKRWHPTQKPEALMRVCIQHGPSNATILDPFMGSGTTLVAAKQLGRKAIGVEIDERYCRIAADRLENTTAPMFTEVS